MTTASNYPKLGFWDRGRDFGRVVLPGKRVPLTHSDQSRDECGAGPGGYPDV
jgi:hypothetical protein